MLIAWKRVTSANCLQISIICHHFLFSQNQIPKETKKERSHKQAREYVYVFLARSHSPLALAVAKTALRQPEVGGFCACSSILNGHSDGECH